MITEEIKTKYNLTKLNCGWYISKQGLILTEDCNIKNYLSKVFKLNEIDERNSKVKEDCLKILARVKNK
jgi:hypothetical protein